ncbi:putative elongator complex protein 1 [Coemansia sp. RSA 1843]|nr:putative elongator complex protein 1 [Coemansia sp. RSA 1843]
MNRFCMIVTRRKRAESANGAISWPVVRYEGGIEVRDSVEYDGLGDRLEDAENGILREMVVNGHFDVARTMFTGLTNKDTDRIIEKVVAIDQKTTTICRRLRKVLQDSGEKKRMPTIPTTFMCQTPADIASAQQLLAPLSTDERNDALTYLLFLSDADTVYNAALGLYGLPLALLVAQRGPCTYLVSLDTLNAIRGKQYQYHNIDSPARLHMLDTQALVQSIWS